MAQLQLRGLAVGGAPTGPSKKAAEGRSHSSCPGLTPTLRLLAAPPAPTQPSALLQPLLSWAWGQATALSLPRLAGSATGCVLRRDRPPSQTEGFRQGPLAATSQRPQCQPSDPDLTAGKVEAPQKALCLGLGPHPTSSLPWLHASRISWIPGPCYTPHHLPRHSCLHLI